ncbi:MAG: hypothetical protein JO112_06235, partial [Planctomycetes bacterium]|nr:hypothetical protein [Planctomycetota bacterium]
MLPTSLAFAWMFWRRQRWGFLVTLGYVLVAGVLSAVLPAQLPLERAPAAFALLTFPSMYPAAFLLGMFCLVEANTPISGRHSCFPADLFLLPVRTGALAVWPMVYGTAAACGLWLVLAWCIMQPWMTLWSDWVPPWWPALLATAALAWLQAVLWWPFGLRGLRVVVLLLLIPGMFVLAQVSVLSGTSDSILVGLFAGLAVPGWTLGYLGVRHGRRGDAPDWEGLLEPWRRLVRRPPQRRRPFASAAWAQTWFEWRRTGNSLPIMTGLLLPVELLWLAFGVND